MRAERFLIQTIGQAPRHVEVKALVYSFIPTDSIAKPIRERGLRLGIQKAYKELHGIVPTLAGKKYSNSTLSFWSYHSGFKKMEMIWFRSTGWLSMFFLKVPMPAGLWKLCEN